MRIFVIRRIKSIKIMRQATATAVINFVILS